LTLALNLLDIPTLHHYSDNNKTTLQHVIESNAVKNKKLFSGLDKRYSGFSDFSGFYYYQTLFRQYPNSKFILTVRPADDWIKSLYYNFGKTLYQTDKPEEFYHSSIKFYNQELAKARHFFKDYKQQFLEIRICEGEGWKELCEFLNKDVPAMSFPWKNKTVTKVLT